MFGIFTNSIKIKRGHKMSYNFNFPPIKEPYKNGLDYTVTEYDILIRNFVKGLISEGVANRLIDDINLRYKTNYKQLAEVN